MKKEEIGQVSDAQNYDKESVTIVVPAFNEERTIEGLVMRTRPFGQVLVVDDGSTDRTKSKAQQAGAIVVSHPRNLGYSAALRTGYFNARGRIVAIIDADMQQVPEELPRMILPVLDNQADMVIGSKFLGKLEYRPNIPNRTMDRMVCLILRLRFGLKLTNSFSGMRAVRRSCIDFDYLKSNKHEGVTELNFSFAYHHYRIVEVPRTARKRLSGKSSIRLRDGLRILWRITQLLVEAPVRKDSKS